MNDASPLAHRLREVYLDGRWIANTNIRDQLASTTRNQAVIKIQDLNRIADLAFHLNYYLQGVLEVLNGGELNIRDQYSFDTPPLPSEGDWDKLRLQLNEHAQKMADQIEKYTDDQLGHVFVKPAYGDYRRNIEALIEHGYYHLGQIVLIRKMISKPLPS